MASATPIVIKRKSRHDGASHGAWKVAYADFVTAMMALFIVLWMMNASKQIQVAVGGYFKDPTGTAKMVGTDKSGAGENVTVTKEDMKKLKDELEQQVRKLADFKKLQDHIEMTITSEGLRIELLESETGTFFDTGKLVPNAKGTELLILLAKELGKLPNNVSIEGHTDARPYADGDSYGNWELSADRANAARRMMQQEGLRQNQVSQVRGFADQKPRNMVDRQDPANRRISVIVQHVKEGGQE